MIDPGKGRPQATAGAKTSSTIWKATYQLGRRRGREREGRAEEGEEEGRMGRGHEQQSEELKKTETQRNKRKKVPSSLTFMSSANRETNSILRAWVFWFFFFKYQSFK